MFRFIYSFIGASLMDQEVKNLSAVQGSIPGLGRCSGEGNGCALRYSCLENPTDRGAWCAIVHGIAKESDMNERLALSLLTVSLKTPFDRLGVKKSL